MGCNESTLQAFRKYKVTPKRTEEEEEPVDASDIPRKPFGKAVMSRKQKRIVQQTAPLIQERIYEIANTFYPLMFSRYPHVKSMFNQNHQKSGAQPKALGNAVVLYATHLDRLEELQEYVSAIVHKHCALNVKAEQYPIVGECLLTAVYRVMGPEVITEEVLDAWKAAYNQLAQLLMDAEEHEYRRKERMPGGWRGGRTFQICDKVPESELIKSFYLRPKDGKAIMKFQPGQYVGVRVNVDGEEMQRPYSISSPPDDNSYRISIRKEETGTVSKWFHEKVTGGTEIIVFPPAGDFVLQDGDFPLLFCTAGVGQTPNISMVEHIVRHSAGRSVTWVHCTKKRKFHAFRERIEEISQNNPNFDYLFSYTDDASIPYKAEKERRGLVTKEVIARYIPEDRDIDCYVIGPKGFMRNVLRFLKELEVPREQWHWEYFGPKDEVDPDKLEK